MEVRAHRVQTVLTQMTRQHEHVSIAHVNAFLSTLVCWRAHENARAHGVNLVHVLITASACVRACVMPRLQRYISRPPSVKVQLALSFYMLLFVHAERGRGQPPAVSPTRPVSLTWLKPNAKTLALLVGPLADRGDLRTMTVAIEPWLRKYQLLSDVEVHATWLEWLFTAHLAAAEDAAASAAATSTLLGQATAVLDDLAACGGRPVSPVAVNRLLQLWRTHARLAPREGDRTRVREAVAAAHHVLHRAAHVWLVDLNDRHHDIVRHLESENTAIAATTL
jgi:hypothetical protein